MDWEDERDFFLTKQCDTYFTTSRFLPIPNDQQLKLSKYDLTVSTAE